MTQPERPAQGPGHRRADRAHQQDRRRPATAAIWSARLARAGRRITDPQIRVVIAGQLKQGKSQLLNSLLNMPVARVGDDESTVLATMVSYGEQAAAHLIVAPPDGAEPEAIEIPTADLQQRPAPGAAGRRPRGAARRGDRAQPAAQGRPGIHRHPRGRRPRPAAPVGDARAVARRRRDADGQRHQPGVHRTRDDVHPAGVRDLPGRRDRRDQDRPVPALARRSSTPTTPTCSGPASPSR